MEEWFRDNAWVVWTAAAVALGLAEMVSLDFVLLMFAAGAGAGAISSLVSPYLWIDVLVAVAVSVAMLGLVRPSLVKKLHAGSELTTGHAALVGRKAIVVEQVDEHGGQVRLAGEVWSARVFDPATRIDAGAEVEVFEIDGATAVVYPMD